MLGGGAAIVTEPPAGITLLNMYESVFWRPILPSWAAQRQTKAITVNSSTENFFSRSLDSVSVSLQI